MRVFRPLRQATGVGPVPGEEVGMVDGVLDLSLSDALRVAGVAQRLVDALGQLGDLQVPSLSVEEADDGVADEEFP